MMGRLVIYFRKPPETDRFFPGDRFIRPLLRRILRPRKTSGIEKVVLNLCKGLELIGQPYELNPPFARLKKEDRIVVLGLGKYALEGFPKDLPFIAGIGLMTHPMEWPEFCLAYQVSSYLQHSQWTRNLYAPHFGEAVCKTWPAGIETGKWTPGEANEKDIDVLIYDKIYWERERRLNDLLQPILDEMDKRGLRWQKIRYGEYAESGYLQLLKRSRSMIFLSAHESQGFACCEALSCNVPVLAWDQGFWLDPSRFAYGENQPVPATSVPFFDERCGERFTGIGDFAPVFERFYEKAASGSYSPRNYILENLTLEKSAELLLSIVNSTQGKEA